MRHHVGILLGLTALLPAPAADAHRPAPACPPWHPPVQTYTTFKVGGFGADALGPHGGSNWGLFLGAEWGIAPAPPIELGMSIDWFHRRDDRGAVLFVDDLYAYPVEVWAADGTTTDLIPFAAVVRARFPVGNGQLTPFVAGQLGWDVLRLELRRVVTDGSAVALLEGVEWFHGMAAGFSAGLEAAVGPGVSLVFEAGLHDSEPHRNLFIGGIPVTARVDADGEYARAGVKLAF